eukprot:3736787-Prymnesium_polylepis.2
MVLDGAHGFAVPWDLHPRSLHAEFAHNTDLLLTLDHAAVVRARPCTTARRAHHPMPRASHRPPLARHPPHATRRAPQNGARRTTLRP